MCLCALVVALAACGGDSGQPSSVAGLYRHPTEADSTLRADGEGSIDAGALSCCEDTEAVFVRGDGTPHGAAT
jgi:hypothetical protein